MSADVIVRPARPDDIEALGRLGTYLVEEHYGFDPQRFIEPHPDTPRRYGEFLEAQSAGPDRFVLIAEQDGAVVGYVFGGMEGADYMVLRGPAGAIYDLVVDPDRRRQGIGKMLLDAALAALAERGAPRAVLGTAEKNSNAQRLFERSGFRRTLSEMTREL